jgi:hypothetical protein
MTKPSGFNEASLNLFEDGLENQAVKKESEFKVSSTPFSDPLQTVKHDKLTGQVIPAAGRVESPTARATDHGCDHGGSKSHLELS